jgi:hypothetical protein
VQRLEGTGLGLGQPPVGDRRAVWHRRKAEISAHLFSWTDRSVQDNEQVSKDPCSLPFFFFLFSTYVRNSWRSYRVIILFLDNSTLVVSSSTEGPVKLQ